MAHRSRQRLTLKVEAAMAVEAAVDYRPMLKAYHHAREPLYRQIMADALAGAGPAAVILDAGSGDAFYARLMAEVLPPARLIVALDLDRRQLAAGPACAPVALCQGDMEQPGLPAKSFDAVWLCRALHSAPDPPRRLAALARLLRPGGRLVVVENDFAHHPILAWPADFERRVLAAHYQYLESRCSAEATLERYHSARHLPRWLRQAGLAPAFFRTYLSEDAAPLTPAVETYWGLFLQWLRYRVFPYLSEADRDTYLDFSDPASPNYLPAQDSAYCLELTAVGCGVAPM